MVAPALLMTESRPDENDREPGSGELALLAHGDVCDKSLHLLLLV